MFQPLIDRNQFREDRFHCQTPQTLTQKDHFHCQSSNCRVDFVLTVDSMCLLTAYFVTDVVHFA